MHGPQNTLLPYRYERTVWLVPIMLRNESMNSLEINEKKIISRLKHSQHKKFCLIMDVYKIYEGNDFNKIYDSLS